MSHHFDDFSRLVAGGSIPRRESLRRLGLAVSATILSPLGAEFARAGKQPKPPTPPKAPKDPCRAFCTCRNKRQLDQCLKVCSACGKNPQRLGGSCGSYFCCGAGQTSCGNYCADLAFDPDNCGACGYVCDEPGPLESGACIDGRCMYACVEGADYCDGLCTFLEDDPDNCGTCGAACNPSEVCISGQCVTPPECQPWESLCHGYCVNLDWNHMNCGACGNVCPPGFGCSFGVCGSPGGGDAG